MRQAVPAAAFLVVWQLGLLTLAPGFPHGDSGETVGAALHLGIAHPPGYPLPTMLGHLAVRCIPAGSPAWRVSLLSLGCAAAAAAAGAVAVSRLVPGVPWWILLAAALAGGMSLEVWNQMTLPKGSVYTVTVGLLAAVAATVASRRQARGRRWMLAGLATGLAVGGHYYMLVPFLPFLGGALVADAVRSAGRRGIVRLCALALLGCTVAGSVYLYLPLRTSAAHPSFRWGEPDSWKRFRWLVFRQQYVFIEKQERGDGGRLLFGRFAGRFRAGFGWAGIVLVPAALALAWRRRAWWLVAVAAGGVAETAAAALYPKLEPDALWVADPFFTGGWWAMGLLISSGVVLVSSGRGLWWRKAALALAALLVARELGAGFGVASKARNYYASDFMANLAATLPKNAILFTEGDAYIAPLLHGLFVDGVRPDVRMIIPIFLHFGWGLEQLSMQYPDLILRAKKPWNNVWIEARDIMEDHPDRPWCYTLTTSTGWPFGKWAVNEGLFYRLRVRDVPRGAEEDAVDRRNLRWRLRGMFSPDIRREPFERVVREDYIAGYFGRGIWRHTRREAALAMTLFERARRLGSPEAALNAGLAHFEAGNMAEAERCWQEARDGAPRRPEPWVNLALVALRKSPPRADEAIRLCGEGLARDPNFARGYEVQANAWFMKGDLPQAVSCIRKAMELDPRKAKALGRVLRAMTREGTAR